MYVHRKTPPGYSFQQTLCKQAIGTIVYLTRVIKVSIVVMHSLDLDQLIIKHGAVTLRTEPLNNECHGSQTGLSAQVANCKGAAATLVKVLLDVKQKSSYVCNSARRVSDLSCHGISLIRR